jgi:hypothetical protein
MPRRADYEDDSDEEFDPSDGEDEESTVPCPYCRRHIHEDAQRCPYCENYLSEEDAPPGRKPWWLLLGVLAALYAVYRWIVG